MEVLKNGQGLAKHRAEGQEEVAKHEREMKAGGEKPWNEFLGKS